MAPPNKEPAVIRPFCLGIVLFLATVTAVRAERVELVPVNLELDGPFGVAFTADDAAYLVEISGGRVLKVARDGMVTRIGGAKVKGSKGDGGPALDAEFNGMHSLVVAPNDDIYVADTWNHRVRKIDLKTGIITNVAGTDEKGFSGDGGSAVAAQTGDIYCLALGPDGKQLYLADLGNKRIRKVDLTTGVITTVAGNGQEGVPKDGADAATSPLVDPRAVAVDSQNNVYVLERRGNALRVVDPAGKIRTVVGTGAKGNSGDGGDAKLATLNGPKHLCIDLEDNVIIADAENHVVRKYLPKTGQIVRVAGSGTKGTAGVGGPALDVQLNRPHGVTVHKSGTIYIVDSSNDRVLKLVP
jgi:sugar lactone lactonase YvrE